MLALRKTLVGEANNQDLFRVTKKMSIGTSKMVATFRNLCGGGEEVELVCKGSIFDHVSASHNKLDINPTLSEGRGG